MAVAKSSARRTADVMKLMMSSHAVELADDKGGGGATLDFQLSNFRGPEGSPYAGGVFKLGVHLPQEYPFKSPSIGFLTRVFHPNIDERSGTVCLDVINQAWTPMYDLVNVFDAFLPQLLLYPNPSDPLNGEAAALLARDPERYAAKVREYVARYATPSAPAVPVAAAPAPAGAAPTASASPALATTSAAATASPLLGGGPGVLRAAAPALSVGLPPPSLELAGGKGPGGAGAGGNGAGSAGGGFRAASTLGAEASPRFSGDASSAASAGGGGAVSGGGAGGDDDEVDDDEDGGDCGDGDCGGSVGSVLSNL